MTNNKKLILGVFTIFPAAYLLFFFGFIFIQLIFSAPGSSQSLDGFAILAIVHGINMLFIPVLLFIYIKNVFNNPRISSDKRTMWTIVILMGNIFAMPIYWYLNIWKSENTPAPLAKKHIMSTLFFITFFI